MTAAVSFVDVQRMLSLFAQGLAGRHCNLRLEHSCEATPTDFLLQPTRITLPPDIATFPTAAQNLGAYRISVLRQIGGLADDGTEWDVPGFLAAARRPELLRQVFAVVEDVRVYAQIRRRYPGARADLQRVLDHERAHRPALDDPAAIPAVLEALTLFAIGEPRHSLELQDATGFVAPLLEALRPVEVAGSRVADSARVALHIYRVLDGPVGDRTPQPATLPLQSDPHAPVIPGRSASPAGSGDTMQGATLEMASDAVADSRVLGGRRGQPGTNGHDSTAAEDSMMKDPEGGVAPRLTTLPRVRASERAMPGDPRSFFYDEWDYLHGAYLKSWCRVNEQRLHGDDFGFINGVHRRHAALISRVRSQFESIKPESWHRVRRTSDGDELELDGVIEAVIDRRRGFANDSHLYIRRDRALRDVAAAFLLDMSASTDFPLPEEPSAAVESATGNSEPGLWLYSAAEEVPPHAAGPKRRVIDVAKDALALMCDALRTLGDIYAIYGFSGDGRDDVEFHVAKDFRDKLSARTWAALGAIKPRRSTRMGPAIRHALTKLGRETAGTKVLIIISDGYPEDRDYGPDRNDHEYGIQDTARALKEAATAGVIDFCVTIDPSGHDYLKRMCAASRYLVIDDVTALPRELTKVYRTLIA